jgi:hypothetical protein
MKKIRLSLLRKVENSMIFSCLTPNPKGEHLKIIELESHKERGLGSQRTFRSGLKVYLKKQKNLIFNALTLAAK